jgi:multicomponent Na+:H+ antiporter subunit B
MVTAGLAALVLLAVLPALLRAMPEFGAHPLPYGDAVNALLPAARGVMNMVSAVNFDLRALDTLGEETMLLAAVSGATVLLRGERGERETRPAALPGRPVPPRSEAVELLCRVLFPVLLVFGLSIVLHAQLTPGGGFQGGVIIATALLLLWLGAGYRAWRRLLPSHALHAVEGAGLALYVLTGCAGLLAGRPFLTNLLPNGSWGSLLSGGMIPVLNLGVALAVAGGFAMLLLEFLEETRASRPGEE